MSSFIRETRGGRGRVLGRRLLAAFRHGLIAPLVAIAFALVLPAPSHAESRNLAPEFTALQRGAKVLVAPLDVELFSLSAGGIAEPRADWTATAHDLMKKALADKASALGLSTVELMEAQADEDGELLNLHAAVSRSVALHHGVGGVWALPTKEGRLLWSFGDVLQPLGRKTGARYALFTWVRDSYASAERVATMVLMAALGVGISGGIQVGYASLVDLETGQVVWFNQLGRGTGDLRDAKSAQESVDALLAGFPPAP